jgi:hypothetical protein
VIQAFSCCAITELRRRATVTTSDPSATTERRGRHAADYAELEPNESQQPPGDDARKTG